VSGWAVSQCLSLRNFWILGVNFVDVRGVLVISTDKWQALVLVLVLDADSCNVWRLIVSTRGGGGCGESILMVRNNKSRDHSTCDKGRNPQFLALHNAMTLALRTFFSMNFIFNVLLQ
jgi:hypothetical protein